MRENVGKDDSKWPPLALWPYSAEKIFLIRVCRGLQELVGARPLHLLTQTAPPLKSPTGAFIAAQPQPTPNAAFTSGVVGRKQWMHTLPTLPSPSAAQPSQSSLRNARFPFLSPAVTSSPGRGKSFLKAGALGSPRKVHLFAKASPFGRGGYERSEQTERARTVTRACLSAGQQHETFP